MYNKEREKYKTPDFFLSVSFPLAVKLNWVEGNSCGIVLVLCVINFHLSNEATVIGGAKCLPCRQIS
jgi:hypothetical protein